MRTCVATEESSFAQAREHLPASFTLGHTEKGPCLSKPDEMKEVNDGRRNGPRALAFQADLAEGPVSRPALPPARLSCQPHLSSLSPEGQQGQLGKGC